LLNHDAAFALVQIELNKKRESEINKLRKDLELANAAFEAQEASLRKRHTEAVNDLSDQVDYLTKTKSRSVPI
jgi:hypothetical protein